MAPNGLANICIRPLTSVVVVTPVSDVFVLDVADIVNNCTSPAVKKLGEVPNKHDPLSDSPTPVEAMTRLVLT